MKCNPNQKNILGLSKIIKAQKVDNDTIFNIFKNSHKVFILGSKNSL